MAGPEAWPDQRDGWTRGIAGLGNGWTRGMAIRPEGIAGPQWDG
jgi:hypothetical protein